MEQSSNPAEPHFVCKQGDVDHDVQSNSLFRHDFNSNVIELTGGTCWNVERCCCN